MTSATERLRALLDERGVEWWQSANTLGCVFTRWYSPLFGDEVCAMENGEEGLVLFDHFVTPEQAVDATLGPGTCHAVFEVDAMSEDERVGEFVCSECGETFGDGRDQRPNYCPNCGRKVVKCHDEDYDPEKGLAMALCQTERFVRMVEEQEAR